MIEIRIHGRGGQGAVTASQLLAMAAFKEGYNVQAFPSFGTERTGAPVASFARLDKKQIKIRSQVYTPDYMLVLDPTLLNGLHITNGLKKNGLIIINTRREPEEFKLKHDVKTIDVTSQAVKIFHKPIVNTGLLAAFAAITKVISLKSVISAVNDKYDGKIAKMNVELVKKIYEESK
ncbi:MAG: pyruvate ferredoxin oxidoreductase subunit gamma [Nanoarchaeota archaeon]|nr:pyruvate ferredoxin oxidoreductase subunit gamma [Nanoarchaeota archaeon]